MKSEGKIEKIEYEQPNRSTSCTKLGPNPSLTKVVDRGTSGTYVELAVVLDRASTAGEEEQEDARASQASHHTRSSSAHDLPHRYLQGVAACAVDTPTVVASSPGLSGTSFQGVLGAEGSSLRAS
jgi:hypothetical protein